MIFEKFEVEFRKLTNWHKRRLDSGQVEMWFERTKHIPIEAFAAIVTDCIDNLKYFPTPGQVKEAYQDWLHANPEKRAREPWDTEVECRECRGLGYLTYWYRVENLLGFILPGKKRLPVWYSAIVPCAGCENWKRTFPTSRTARPKRFYTRDSLYRDGRLPENPARVAWDRGRDAGDETVLMEISSELEGSPTPDWLKDTSRVRGRDVEALADEALRKSFDTIGKSFESD